jgi:hypothetical protein
MPGGGFALPKRPGQDTHQIFGDVACLCEPFQEFVFELHRSPNRHQALLRTRSMRQAPNTTRDTRGDAIALLSAVILGTYLLIKRSIDG